jgi:hypothetical protein
MRKTLFLLLAALPCLLMTPVSAQLNRSLGGGFPFTPNPSERSYQLGIVGKTIDQGEYTGIETGTAARMFQQVLGPNARITLRAKVIGHFRDPDCKRIEYVYTSDTPIRNPDGGTAPFRAGYQMNICRNGQPPIATPEELRTAMKNPVTKERLKSASVRPYSPEESKTQIVRLIRQAIASPPKTFSEPAEDEGVLAGFRKLPNQQNARITVQVTSIKDIGRSGCRRVNVAYLTDMPLANPSGQRGYGFQQQLNACANGVFSEPDITPPVILVKK